MESARRPQNSPTSPSVDNVCGRCGGLMVIEHYLDLLDDTGQIDVVAWRCTSCGEVIDEVILKNRGAPAPNLLYGTKERTYAQQVEQSETAGSDDHQDRGGAA